MMQDIKQNDGNYRWNREVLVTINIPSTQKEFLSQVGLPRQMKRVLTFGGEALAQLPVLNEQNPGLHVIGRDLTRAICIAGDGTGEVFWVDLVSGVRRFVNSSPAQFSECLLLFEKEMENRRSISWEEARELEMVILSRISTIDNPAASNPEYFWPGVLEQLGT